jgi:methionyl-tRNA formyltransferase
LVSFDRTAKEIYDRWRGFQPWPGAHTVLRGKKLILHAMRVVGDGSPVGDVGVLGVEGDRLVVGCGGGTGLELMEVQMEGKKRMAAKDFLHGFQVRSGERLG